MYIVEASPARMMRAFLSAIVVSSFLLAYLGPSTSSMEVAPLGYPISSSWPAGVRDFLRVETSSPVVNVLYRWGSIHAAPNGAYGPNIGGSRSSWYLEYQRAGSVDVIDGVLRHDPGLIQEGLRMFHFGLARESRNGSFPGSAWPFHGTAMFLAESAPALLVLKYSPVAESYAGELNWQTARMRRAAYRMVRVVHGVGRIDDSTKNHRFYEAAMALGSVGVLAGDRTLQTWSERYAWQGVRMERPDGVMPEEGGYDTGYQALGMMHATRYLELLATGQLHDALQRTLARGEAWELSRVRSDGTIDQQGDTRTTGCQERNPMGQCKTANYAEIANALARWSVIARDPRFQRAAYSVWLQNWQLVPGDVLPAPGLFARPESIRAGQWLTVWGTRFQPLETVKVYLGRTLMQTVRCDQIGSFGGHSPRPNAHFPLPSLSPGVYTITARGSLGTVRRTTITVTG